MSSPAAHKAEGRVFYYKNDLDKFIQGVETT